MKRPKYQVLLYYGIEENETEAAIFHSFRLADPNTPQNEAAIVKDLAEQLDCLPEDDFFQARSMYVDLPEELVRRIQSDAIGAYVRRLSFELLNSLSPAEVAGNRTA